MRVAFLLGLALLLTAAAHGSGPALLTTSKGTVAVQPPACPPFVIVGVYTPSPAQAELGCVYRSGTRGPVTVTFYGTQTAVPLSSAQAVRFQAKRGYYAYPP